MECIIAHEPIAYKPITALKQKLKKLPMQKSLWLAVGNYNCEQCASEPLPREWYKIVMQCWF